METRYLKTLLAVLEGGSFSRAASDLNITQSAVSQRIRFMEEQYGMTLVDRSGTVIAATEAGKIVIGKARQILVLENELKDELKNLGMKVRLSICCTPTFGIVYLPRVLNRFFLVNSTDVNFRSVLNTPEQSLKGLLGNDFDVAVIEHCGKLETADAVTLSLPHDELTLVSAPSLGLPAGQLSLAELFDQRLIARRDGCSSRCLLQENLARFDKKLDEFRGVVVHDDLHLTIQSTLAGQGIAFVSRSVVAGQIDRGELIEHNVEGFRNFRARTVVINRKCGEDGVVRGFIECVYGVFDMAG
jgi:DNA-binding transcriptional LysR family regulator